MKRWLSVGLAAIGIVWLGGCPIYSDDCWDRNGRCGAAECFSAADCPSSAYVCNRGVCVWNGASGSACSQPGDCPAGTSCGSDNRCHPGDCAAAGCPGGYVCALTGGVAQCIALGGGIDAGAPPVDAASDGAVSACTSDGACSALGAGAKCLSGRCLALVDQCTDATQCRAGQQCVDGACTPSCGPTTACPTGYGCDTARGVCTVNPTPCPSAAGCSANSTCVLNRCVARCTSATQCPSGLVCVAGGCVADQAPVFVCSADGSREGCAAGSICLRHNCYIACDGDAGADAGGACRSADRFNVCKAVTAPSGTYAVCGSETNLGNECDPTQGRACSAPRLCIDGFCK